MEVPLLSASSTDFAKDFNSPAGDAHKTGVDGTLEAADVKPIIE